MIRFTLFDLRNAVSTTPVRLLLMLGLIALIGAASPVQGTAIVVGGSIGAIMLTSLFLTDERGRLDALYGLSRVSRTGVVVGRYATALIIAACTSVFGLVVSLILDAIHRASVNWSLMELMGVAAFTVVAVGIALLMPWYFAMGYARGRQGMVVLLSAVVVLGLLGSRTSLFDDIAMPTGLGNIGAGTIAIIVLAGLAVLTASAVLASRLYRNRNL